MPKRRFQICLAGPIHGCNDAQIRRWRDSVKRKYGNQCEFLDPSENPLNQEASPAEVVEADICAIESADGLLVNMWRESIGAALGVVHAHHRGQPVVVSPTPFVIEGRLFDWGVKGTMQSFQVRVQSDDAKETVATAIEEELRKTERWAG